MTKAYVWLWEKFQPQVTTLIFYRNGLTIALFSLALQFFTVMDHLGKDD
jgi:hypothetical protein